jgi:hypothetical protein
MEKAVENEQDCVAMLDWGFAVKLVQLSSGSFDLYVGIYDRPVPVGYFYPKGDTQWGQKLASVFQTAIGNEPSSRTQFLDFMDSALVDMPERSSLAGAEMVSSQKRD